MKLLLPLVFVTIFSACSPSDKKEESSATTILPAATPGNDAGKYTKIWEDNFNGPDIDTSNWIVASLRHPDGARVPGAAGDHLLNAEYAGYITGEDSYIENEALVLRNQKRKFEGSNPEGTYNYTSGWVMSMHKIHFNKGYIEIRAKFPSGDKVWPAWWLIAEDLVWAPEWDMFEYFGYKKDIGYDQMGTHLASGEWPGIDWNSHWISGYDKQFDCEAWHVYGFEWTDSTATWFIDSVRVHHLKATEVPKSQWPDEEMYIVLNNGVRSESPDEKTTWPNYFVIDYVALYKRE